MALVRCKNCMAQFAVGVMPTTTCGLLLFPALAAAVLSPAVAWHRLGWWSICLPVPTFFVAIVSIHFIPWTFEYVFIFRRRCPKCGCRRWTLPFTEGFGM